MLNPRNIVLLTLTSISSLAFTVDRANAVAINLSTGSNPYTFVGPSGSGAANVEAVVNLAYATSPTSLWIGAQSNARTTSVAAGTYTYSTVFDLTGLDKSTTTFGNLRLASDNRFTGFKLNGFDISLTPSLPGPISPVSFNTFTNYLVNAPQFVTALGSGSNTLSFIVENDPRAGGPNPSSLNAEFGLNVEEVPYEFEAAAGFALFGTYFVGKRYLKKKKAPLAK
jgi:hypothetical protein